jgi:hypothetical protein
VDRPAHLVAPRGVRENLEPLWRKGHQSDKDALALIDNHYSRRSHGSNKFMPPGRAVVLVTTDKLCLWACSWPQAHMVNRAYPGAWLCTCFRREGGPKASALILAALAATRHHWGDPPADGVLTLIDPDHVRPIAVRGVWTWGFTWKKVGFRFVGRTKKRGLLMYQLPPELVPPPQPPVAWSGNDPS